MPFSPEDAESILRSVGVDKGRADALLHAAEREAVAPAPTPTEAPAAEAYPELYEKTAELLRGIPAGEGAVLEPGPFETEAALRSCIVAAAHARGLLVLWRRRGEDIEQKPGQLAFRLVQRRHRKHR